jgi:hypothetical protein
MLSVAFRKLTGRRSGLILLAHVLQRGMAQPALAFQEPYTADQARLDPLGVRLLDGILFGALLRLCGSAHSKK